MGMQNMQQRQGQSPTLEGLSMQAPSLYVYFVERAKFLNCLHGFYQKYGMTTDPQLLLMPNGRELELYALYSMVLNFGGGPAVCYLLLISLSNFMLKFF